LRKNTANTDIILILNITENILFMNDSLYSPELIEDIKNSLESLIKDKGINLPIFLFNYKVGEWFLGLGQTPNTAVKIEWDINSITELKSLGLNVFITLFLGSFCIGILAGIFSYFLTLAILTRRQKVRRFPARLG
jgi:hypothetical protein